MLDELRTTLKRTDRSKAPSLQYPSRRPGQQAPSIDEVLKLMFSTTKYFWTAIACAVLLTACGGGNNDVKASDTEVVGDLKASNIDAWSGAGTNRWVGAAGAVPQISVYIPAPADSTQSDLAGKARTTIAEMNRKLAGELVLTEVSSAPATGGYVRVSYLTAFVPSGSTDYASFCSNVSTGPSASNPVSPSSPSGERNLTVAWVNLGNGHCDVSQDIVSHEFGHALGLSNHFQGFGYGPAVSAAYWDVLATLYGNPVLTTAAKLVVRRAAS
jgi:hypothetical protein